MHVQVESHTQSCAIFAGPHLATLPSAGACCQVEDSEGSVALALAFRGTETKLDGSLDGKLSDIVTDLMFQSQPLELWVQGKRVYGPNRQIKVLLPRCKLMSTDLPASASHSVCILPVPVRTDYAYACCC